MYCNPKTLLVGLFKIVYRRLFIGMLKYKTLIKGRYVCIFSSCWAMKHVTINFNVYNNIILRVLRIPSWDKYLSL